MVNKSLTFHGGIVIGVLLVLLGIGAYTVSGFASVTALIPAIFGIPCIILGLVGRRNIHDRVAIYGLTLVAIIVVAGSAQGVGTLITWALGETPDGSFAPITQGVMFVLGVALLLAIVLDWRTG